MSITIIDSTFRLRQFINTDGHQPAFFLCHGSTAVGTHIIEIDDGIARSGIKGKPVVKCRIIGVQFPIHRVAVAAELVDAADYWRGICLLAADGVPSEDVSRVVSTERNDDLVLVRAVGSNIASIAVESGAPAECGESVRSGGTHHVLCGKHFCSLIFLVEVIPFRRGDIRSRHELMHQPSHHDTMCLNSHATSTYVGSEKPAAVTCGLLPCLDVLVGKVFQHQGIGIFQEAGIGRITGYLVVEEQAPVVSIGHGQFAVGKSQPVEHLLHHLIIIVHQRIGLPLFLAVNAQLEHLQGKSCFTQFLDDYILVAGMEIVMVL